jgi:phosphate transport system protein
MRTVFHQRLDALTATIAELCARSGRTVRDATRTLQQADLTLAENIDSEKVTLPKCGASPLISTRAPKPLCNKVIHASPVT